MTNVTFFFSFKELRFIIYYKRTLFHFFYTSERMITMSVFAKLLLLLLCAFFQFHKYTINASNIVVLLTALVLSSLSIVLQPKTLKSKWFALILSFVWSAWLITSLFFKELQCYFPLAIFDIWNWKLPLFCIIGFVCIALECMIEYTTYTAVSSSFFLILLSACAILLQQVIRQSETYAKELKKFRDTSKEHELLIEEKNRRLREQQDAELYTATLKERNRIAREIHDNVGHLLTRSLLQVGAIKTINQNKTLAELLESLHETLNTAMTSIRNSVHDLHNEAIDLQSAIQEITDSVTTFSIHLDYDMGSNIPKNIKYCFITITKEAVNNALKHSNATQMQILLQEHPAFYQLLIQDNGTNISKNLSDGMGIMNMKDRVKTLNGNIKISTEQGFKILISIIKS